MLTAVVATALAGAAPVPAPPAGTVFEARPPLAVTAFAGRVAWLRPRSPGRRTLVVRDPGGRVRAIPVTLPRDVDELALGTDAAGRPTVVISAPDVTKRGRRNSLWAVRVTPGASRLRKLAASRTVKDGMTAPGLRRGVVTWVARGAGDFDGYAERTLQRGSLTSARVERVRGLGSGYSGIERETLPLPSGRVVLVQVEDGDRPGATHARASLIRRGAAPRILAEGRWQTGDGDVDNTGASGFGPLVGDEPGRTITVSRWAAPIDDFDDPITGPRDLVTVDVRTGRSLTRASPGGADVALPLGAEGFAVFHAGHEEYATVPRPARNATGALRLTAE